MMGRCQVESQVGWGHNVVGQSMELWWNITDCHSASQPSAGHSYLVFEPSSQCRVRVLLERASSFTVRGS